MVIKLNPEAVATILQSAETNEIVNRAIETLTMMNSLAPGWQWGVISPENFENDLDQIRSVENNLETAYVAADYEESVARRVRETREAALHKATVQALSVARVAWAEETERTEVLAPLRAAAQRGPEILEEAEAWETAWAEVDPAFEPAAGLTLASFQAQIAAARTAAGEERRMTVRRQRAGARLALALHRLHQLSQRWYAVATATFDETTPEGEHIRKSITTTYVPRYYEAAKRRRAARRAAASTAPAA